MKLRDVPRSKLGLQIFDGSSLRIDFLVVRMNEPVTSGGAPMGERHVGERHVVSRFGAIDEWGNRSNELNEQARGAANSSGSPKDRARPNQADTCQIKLSHIAGKLKAPLDPRSSG
jgi:hypothetical protein